MKSWDVRYELQKCVVVARSKGREAKFETIRVASEEDTASDLELKP